MAYKRVTATSAEAARRKADGPRTTVSKVNYIKGSKRGRMRTYGVYTHRKKK